MKPSDTSHVLTVNELAARWRKSLSAMYCPKDQRQLPSYLLRGHICLSRDDVDTHKADRRRDAVIPPRRP